MFSYQVGFMHKWEEEEEEWVKEIFFKQTRAFHWNASYQSSKFYKRQ